MNYTLNSSLYSYLFLICSIVILNSCGLKLEKEEVPYFDIQGHRGCRGLMPENSIEGFIKALDIGVTTLEMDVVISEDRQVIVSHEPYISSEICLSTENTPLLLENGEQNMYQMTYEEIQQYDCGSMGNTKFPQQSKIKTLKPILSAVLKASEKHARSMKRPLPYYNIEIKSHSRYDNQFHPEPAEFCDLVMIEVKKLNLYERVIIQSFDIRPLRYIHENHPNIRLAYLVENQLSHIHNLQKLGFELDIYSPQKEYVSHKMINDLHERNIKIIPWTVNDKTTMIEFINKGVDGIISDYPNILIEVLDSLDLD